MTRAAIILNPATADASALRDAVEKTMVSAGWSTPIWLETTPEDPGAGMAETAVAGFADGYARMAYDPRRASGLVP